MKICACMYVIQILVLKFVHDVAMTNIVFVELLLYAQESLQYNLQCDLSHTLDCQLSTMHYIFCCFVAMTILITCSLYYLLSILLMQNFLLL